MLPDVDRQQRLHAVAHGVAGVLLADDGQTPRGVLGQPHPPRAEKARGGAADLHLQFVERAEIAVDGLQQLARRLLLGFRRELSEEERVVPRLRGVVVDRPVGRKDDVFQRLPGKGRVDDQLVQFVDITSIMLVVVVVHRLLGDCGRKRVVGIRQVLRGETRRGRGIGRCHNQRC